MRWCRCFDVCFVDDCGWFVNCVWLVIVGFCLWWIMVYLVGVVGAAGLFCGFG